MWLGLEGGVGNRDILRIEMMKMYVSVSVSEASTMGKCYLRNPNSLVAPAPAPVSHKFMLSFAAVARPRGGAAATTKCSAQPSSEVFSVTSSSGRDIDYLGESTKGDLNLNLDHHPQPSLQGPIEQVAWMEAEEAQNLLGDLGIPVTSTINFLFKYNMYFYLLYYYYY